MDNDIKHVHVGQAIDKRRNELGLSKSELGRKIGVPQQHINRILERETMETAKHWTSISFPFSVRDSIIYRHTLQPFHWMEMQTT